MYFRPSCHCRQPSSLDCWLDDPLIRDVMASDGVTQHEMIMLLNRIAERRQQISLRSLSTSDRFGREAQPGE